MGETLLQDEQREVTTVWEGDHAVAAYCLRPPIISTGIVADGQSSGRGALQRAFVDAIRAAAVAG